MVKTALVIPRNNESSPPTASLPKSRTGNDTGTVRILFSVSSVPSRLMIYPVISAMHIGKIVVALFLMTCSAKNGKVQTVPSSAVVEKTVSRTESSIRRTPAQMM